MIFIYRNRINRFIMYFLYLQMVWYKTQNIILNGIICNYMYITIFKLYYLGRRVISTMDHLKIIINNYITHYVDIMTSKCKTCIFALILKLYF